MTACKLPAGVEGQTITRVITRPGYAGWLLALLFACVAYAGFANGATSIPEETRVQIAIALGILAAGVGLVTGAVGVARSPAAWAGVGLLGLFALVSAISVIWSLAPDNGWLAANRAAAYTAVVAIALIAAPSVRRAPQLALTGYLLVTVAVALYALGGKLFPELSIGPIDLDHASDFSRLREPLGYWNALGLFLVLASPACIWAAADRSRTEGQRIGAVLALQLLLVTIALTYSRGAVVAFLAVLVVLVVGADDAAERLRRLGATLIALVGAVPAVAMAFSVDALSSDGVEAADRAGDGALLAFVLAVSLLAVAGATLAAINSEHRLAWREQWTGAARRLGPRAAAAAVVVVVAALALSDRGLTGSVSHQWDRFTDPVEVTNDPERLLSGSGSNRWVWWREAGGASWDRPIAGWGAGSFPILHYQYAEHQTQTRSTHDVPLQFLVETGLIGTVLGLAGLVLLGLAAVRQVRASEGAERSARLALLATATAWAIHSLYDWDWEIPAVTLPALLAAAIAAAPFGPNMIRFLGDDESEGVDRIGPPRRKPPLDARSPAAVPVALGAVLLATVITVSSAMPSRARDKVLSAQEIASAPDASEEELAGALEEAESAHDTNPLALEPLFTAAALEERLGNLERAEELLIEAARLQPESIRPWQRLLVLETKLGDLEVTELALQKSLEADPGALGFAKLGTALLSSARADGSPTALGTPPRP